MKGQLIWEEMTTELERRNEINKKSDENRKC